MWRTSLTLTDPHSPDRPHRALSEHVCICVSSRSSISTATSGFVGLSRDRWCWMSIPGVGSEVDQVGSELHLSWIPIGSSVEPQLDGYPWHPYWINVGSLWDQCWILMGSILDPYGINVGSLLARYLTLIKLLLNLCWIPILLL